MCSSPSPRISELVLVGPQPQTNNKSGSTTSKKYMNLTKREAAYQEARSRVFANFQQKSAKGSTEVTGTARKKNFVAKTGREAAYEAHRYHVVADFEEKEVEDCDNSSMSSFSLVSASGSRSSRSMSSSDWSFVGRRGRGFSLVPSQARNMKRNSTNNKSELTIVEREAAYQVARARLSIDLGKQSAKNRASTSSSVFSFVLASESGSGSRSGRAEGTGGVTGSAASDGNDPSESAPADSDWAFVELGRKLCE